MAYLFPSQLWTEQFHEKINESGTYASAASNWEGDILLLVEDGGGIYLDLWHGKCRQATYFEDPSVCNAEFKISATMEKWKRVLEGKLDPVQGMITRQIKLDGNLVKIMKNVRAAQELVRCTTKIDTSYE